MIPDPELSDAQIDELLDIIARADRGAARAIETDQLHRGTLKLALACLRDERIRYRRTLALAFALQRQERNGRMKWSEWPEDAPDQIRQVRRGVESMAEDLHEIRRRIARIEAPPSPARAPGDASASEGADPVAFQRAAMRLAMICRGLLSQPVSIRRVVYPDRSEHELTFIMHLFPGGPATDGQVQLDRLREATLSVFEQAGIDDALEMEDE